MRSFFPIKKRDSENVAVSLSHDLSLLRLFEAFSESAPQLVLMLTVMLQTGDWQDPVTGVCVGSGTTFTFTVFLDCIHKGRRLGLSFGGDTSFSCSQFS